MAGSISDKLDRVSDSTSGRPIIATLSAGHTIGGTSVTLSAATNWTTTTKLHFAIYKVTAAGIKDPTTQTDWVGTLSGTTISNLSLTGGNDQAYLSGDIVELTPTSRYAKDLYDWGIAQHDQSGAHTNVTATTVTTTGAVTAGNGLTVSAGTVTAPNGSASTRILTNPYKFRAYKNTAQNTTAGSYVKINLAAENFDTGNNFDSTTNYNFTAPVAGFYQFNGAAYLPSTAGTTIVALQIFKNGTAVSGGNVFNASAASAGVSISDILQLAATDVIDLRIYCNGAAAISTAQTDTFFSGFLVSTT